MMKEYKIEIKELLKRIVTIEAESEEEALKMAKEKYRNEEIILDYTDFKDVDLKNV